MFCTQCGETVSADSQFCSKCGGQVAPLESSPAAKAEVSLSEMYAAYIGPGKSGYYVPIFERFDKGASAMSWNWPAALITQIWMLYRGMFLWGFLLYPILSFSFTLLAVAILAGVGGGIGEALYIPVMFAPIIVMGLFSNKILHRHVRRKIDKSGRLGLSDQQRRDWLIRKGANNFVFVFIMILVGVAVIGILAAIALPAYQDYTTRAKVQNGLLNADSVKQAYLEYVLANEQWPASMADLGVPETDARHGAAVASVTVGHGHELRITFSESSIAGQALILVPSIENDGLAWNCVTETLANRYVPVECRN